LNSRIILRFFIFFLVQVDGLGNLLNFLIIELGVILKQQIVKLQKFSLLTGSKAVHSKFQNDYHCKKHD